VGKLRMCIYVAEGHYSQSIPSNGRIDSEVTSTLPLRLFAYISMTRLDTETVEVVSRSEPCVYILKLIVYGR
jgi:hypothetical protein